MPLDQLPLVGQVPSDRVHLDQVHSEEVVLVSAGAKFVKADIQIPFFPDAVSYPGRTGKSVSFLD